MTLDFSWELDFWGRNRAALAAATSERHAAAADAAQARLMLRHFGGQRLCGAGSAPRPRAIPRRPRSRCATRPPSCFISARSNGLETLGSVRQADSRMAGAQGELLAADEQIALVRNRIAALIGAGPDRGLAIACPTIKLDRASGAAGQACAEPAGQASGRRRPRVCAPKRPPSASMLPVPSSTPNVNLSAFIGVQSLGLDKLFKSGSDIGSVGPAASSLPIFNGGRLKAQVKGRTRRLRRGGRDLRGHGDRSAARSRRLGCQLARSGGAARPAARRLSQRLAKPGRSRAIRYDGGLSNYLDVLSAEDVLPREPAPAERSAVARLQHRCGDGACTRRRLPLR